MRTTSQQSRLSSLRLLLLTLSCAAASVQGLQAQTVHVVDELGGSGSDFTEVQDAVDAAAEGDTVLVRSGSYSSLLVRSKSLVIEADVGATVTLNAGGFSVAPIRVEQLVVGQHVVLRGLSTALVPSTSVSASIELQDNQGTVWLEDCVTPFFEPSLPTIGLAAVDCAGVTLVRCEIEGSSSVEAILLPPGVGLLSLRTNLSLWETKVTGARGATCFLLPPGNGGDGLVVEGGTIFASGCLIRGGSGVMGCSDSNASDGGKGLLMRADDPVVRLLDTPLFGGPGGSADPPAMPGRDGEDVLLLSGTLETLDETSRSYGLDSPVRAGTESLNETFVGVPGDTVFVAYSLVGPQAGFYLGLVTGDLVLAPPLVVLSKGAIDSSGTLVQQVPTAPLPTGVASQTVFLQGVAVRAGGQSTFLMSPSVLLLLGAGL